MRQHSNLYEFIEINEQTATEVTIQQLEGGGRLRAKRGKVVERLFSVKRAQKDSLTISWQEIEF